MNSSLPSYEGTSYSISVMSDVYRLAASILVLRPTEVSSRDGSSTVYQLLLLHKPRKKDAWQLPQGGVEAGENIEQAALRELKEEAGCKCGVLGKSLKVYQYDFPQSFRRFRPDNVKGQRIEYVFAIVEPDCPINVDNKEIDAFQWINPSQIPLFIKRQEYLDLIQELYGEAVAAVKNVNS